MDLSDRRGAPSKRRTSTIYSIMPKAERKSSGSDALNAEQLAAFRAYARGMVGEAAVGYLIESFVVLVPVGLNFR
jgi:hypothetical protein